MFRTAPDTTIYALIFILSLILIAWLKVSYAKKFTLFTSLLFNFKFIKIYSRDIQFTHPFELVLFLNTVLNTTVFCSFFVNVLQLELNTILIVKLFFSILFLIVFKISFEKLLGTLLEIKSTIF